MEKSIVKYSIFSCYIPISNLFTPTGTIFLGLGNFSVTFAVTDFFWVFPGTSERNSKQEKVSMFMLGKKVT